ncbi:MarR family winged helix-turn-helix transcriptional regulator [Nocardioides sp.]|uniref:MarR family winged helix-turn-helix transcriptional regulator n=1 Tax=Nocardioides sp. TaxID=35761 RepID=UPI002B5A8461|nr:MarR family transcriptional regulator [Nocardioides sp.]HVX54265.1 MarR family transcriptional regulator [Nocardioides sp.]
MTDHVARVIAQWRRERPDLDPSPQGVIARLHRIANRLTEELVAVYAAHELGEGEFDILATLRRQGAPYALSAGELAAQTMVTSGAITKRVDRCIVRGWVTRAPSDVDGRGRVVALTPAGRALIDAAFTDHLANEKRLLAHFTVAEREQLAGLLTGWAEELGL